MGNAASGEEGTSKDVVLSLHFVHNVNHGDKESYYGMATNHLSASSEVPVTSEHPARLAASLDGVVSVRIFLHERGTQTANDRPVGQLSIPIRQMLDRCGPGIYQTWFLLDACSPYKSMRSERVVERFEHALYSVSTQLHAPRICLTLLEASVEPSEWIKDEKERVAYYDTLLVSHMQHMQMTGAYFDYLEGVERTHDKIQKQKDKIAMLKEQSRGQQHEKSNLQLELESLRNMQQEQEETLRRQHGAQVQEYEAEADRLRRDNSVLAGQLSSPLEPSRSPASSSTDEVARLQRELDTVTEEANRRIEQGNESILKLKGQLKQLRDVEEPRMRREHGEAERKLEAAKLRNAEAKERLREVASAEDDAELQDLRLQVATLSKQKAALMEMVQNVYGAPSGAEATESSREDEKPPAAAPAAAFQPPEREGAGQPSSEMFLGNLLPDPSELLGGGAPRRL